MAINVKNIAKSSVFPVYGVKVTAEGSIISKNGKPLTTRFVQKHAEILDEHRDADGAQWFTLREGFELVKTRTRRATDADTTDTTDTADADTTDTTDTADADTTDTTDTDTTTTPTAPTFAPVAIDTDTEADADTEAALISAIKRLRGGNIDAAKVEAIIDAKLAALAKTPEKMKLAIKAAAKKVGEVFCTKFSRIVAKVARGNHVYLYGPAGSGKSHTAEQVARELGLDFYGQTTIQFAHDVRGYGDAGGNFQETPFFKAFAHGGLYFQDEYDRSNAEAAIVLNSALANGWYDFPVVGRVVAHPKFRFMAAGNTTMSGASEEYITGQEIDPSSRDRFAFYFEVNYNHEVEMSIAHGNAETVAFVEDVRRSIKETGVKHVVSYRATAAMTDELENENDREACIVEAVFKGLEVDERSIIYGSLNDKTNEWAKALKRTL